MTELKSERVILETPMSFAGSAKRIWRLSDKPLIKYTVLLFLIAMAWMIVVCWYFLIYIVFGLLFIPWRILRRAQRGNKQRKLQHRELLEAINNSKKESA